MVRSLIPDTNSVKPIFQDEELNSFIQMESSQGLYASGQMFSTANQYTSMANVYSPRRAAAMAIDVIASDRARLATLQQVLDVKIDGGKAQSALHEIAESLREQDTYGFAIAEIVFDPFSARERMMNQLLRLTGA